MIRVAELDPNVTLGSQMEVRGGPVVLVALFQVEPDGADQFLRTWARDAAFMKSQPGFISTQLHRGLAGSHLFMNYAVWESVDAFRRAFQQPQFQAAMRDYPTDMTASPHLFAKMAIPGICTA